MFKSWKLKAFRRVQTVAYNYERLFLYTGFGGNSNAKDKNIPKTKFVQMSNSYFNTGEHDFPLLLLPTFSSGCVPSFFSGVRKAFFHWEDTGSNTSGHRVPQIICVGPVRAIVVIMQEYKALELNYWVMSVVCGLLFCPLIFTAL